LIGLYFDLVVLLHHTPFDGVEMTKKIAGKNVQQVGRVIFFIYLLFLASFSDYQKLGKNLTFSGWV
jgi:hypothetical protein